jgi:hypothetical protein
MNDGAKSKIRPDEQFCIEAVVASVGGQWSEGEDPPDAYLNMGNKRIALEISILTQYVMDQNAGCKPRLSEDTTAIRLCNELNHDLKNDIPKNRTVLLILSAPINSARKLKPKLSAEIMALVGSAASYDVTVTREIMGNKITIHLILDGRPSGKKIVGVVQNEKSSADILANATSILADRIDVKTQKCKSLQSGDPLWLVLFNDYWLADIDTYRQAMSKLSFDHPFEKILIISGDKSVEILDEKHNKPIQPTP